MNYKLICCESRVFGKRTRLKEYLREIQKIFRRKCSKIKNNHVCINVNAFTGGYDMFFFLTLLDDPEEQQKFTEIYINLRYI